MAAEQAAGGGGDDLPAFRPAHLPHLDPLADRHLRHPLFHDVALRAAARRQHPQASARTRSTSGSPPRARCAKQAREASDAYDRTLAEARATLAGARQRDAQPRQERAGGQAHQALESRSRRQAQDAAELRIAETKAARDGQRPARSRPRPPPPSSSTSPASRPIPDQVAKAIAAIEGLSTMDAEFWVAAGFTCFVLLAIFYFKSHTKIGAALDARGFAHPRRAGRGRASSS